MAQAPAGWYPQPDGTQRYWDGAQWTEHVHGTPAAASAPAPAAVVTPEPAPVAVVTPEPAPEPVPAAEPAAKAKPATKSKAAVAAAATAPTPAEPISEPAAAEPVVFAGSDMPATVPSSETVATPAPAAPMGAAPAAVAPAKKRKIWPIVLGVVGAIVLVFIIAIVAVVVLLRNAVGDPNDAIALYDDAWQNVDCQALADSTTQAFQESQGYDDCATFESYAQPFADSIIVYDVSVVSTEISNDTAYVTTEEYYLDVDGTETTYTYEYTLEKSGGEWLIDSVTSVTSE